MSYGTGTITGSYLQFDDTPAAGTARVIPNVPAVRDLDGSSVLIGPFAPVQLDNHGAFSIDVPATDDPNLDPSGFAYNVVVILTDGTRLVARGVQLSAGTTVDVIDWTDVNPAPPTYISVGPPGPEGPAGPQGPAGTGTSDAIEYQQTTPAGTWIIPVPEPFGRRPSVTVYVSGEQVEADVTASDSAVTVQFPTPTAGTAVLT